MFIFIFLAMCITAISASCTDQLEVCQRINGRMCATNGLYKKVCPQKCNSCPTDGVEVCEDFSPQCELGAFRCSSSNFQRNLCKKTCGLCDTENCGRSKIAPSRLVAGTENVIPHSWPWAAALYYFAELRCSAVILNEYWVLTAGHCIAHDMEDAWPYDVKIGVHGVQTYSYTQEVGQSIEVSSFILHPSYNYDRTLRNFKNDLSLVKLSEPIKFGENVQPVCLPKNDDDIASLCFSTGWNFDETLSPKGLNIPYQIGLDIIPTDACMMLKNIHNDDAHITDKLLCAKNPETSFGQQCPSIGGPFVCQSGNGNWVLQGIVNLNINSPCYNRRFATLITKVSEYRDWIDQNINH